MSSRASLETGVLYCDDNWRRLAQLPGECVDLIYLDPPFFSNKHYEVIWGDEAEVRSFDDRWEGGIEHYVGWMRDRLMEMHRVLAPTAQSTCIATGARPITSSLSWTAFLAGATFSTRSSGATTPEGARPQHSRASTTRSFATGRRGEPPSITTR